MCIWITHRIWSMDCQTIHTHCTARYIVRYTVDCWLLSIITSLWDRWLWFFGHIPKAFNVLFSSVKHFNINIIKMCWANRAYWAYIFCPQICTQKADPWVWRGKTTLNNYWHQSQAVKQTTSQRNLWNNENLRKAHHSFTSNLAGNVWSHYPHI